MVVVQKVISQVYLFPVGKTCKMEHRHDCGGRFVVRGTFLRQVLPGSSGITERYPLQKSAGESITNACLRTPQATGMGTALPELNPAHHDMPVQKTASRSLCSRYYFTERTAKMLTKLGFVMPLRNETFCQL